MYTIANELEKKFRGAFTALGISESIPVLLQDASRSEYGDYQVNGIMAAAKSQKCNPRELANKVIGAVDCGNMLSKIEVAGPGFINLHLNDAYLSSYLMQNGANPACKNSQNDLIVVDYSAPNLAKEMHVGHLRSTIIGDALVRMFEYLGNKVIRRNHVGDWGTQFGMLTACLVENKQSAEELVLGDLESFYRKAKVRFDEDEIFANKSRDYVVKLQGGDPEILAIWRKFVDISLKHCEIIYAKLGVKLTREDAVGESSYNDALAPMVANLTKQNIIVESNGAKCVFFADGEINTKEETPFIVQKSDGGYLYATTDLAAIDDRVNKLGANRLVYVIDARQSLHMKQLFATSKKAHLVKPDTKLEHVAFGTMMGEDGRPFKTRSGDTIKLINLLDEAINRAYTIINERESEWSEDAKQELATTMAIASVKYADLAKNRVSDYIFSFDKMLAFDGNTAPYLLYAYTRIQSILRKYTGEVEFNTAEIIITNKDEHNLAVMIAKFSDHLVLSSNECYPHYLCLYLYNLAGLFMRFYEACPILNAESDELIASRLHLANLTAFTLKTGFDVLGINTVDKM